MKRPSSQSSSGFAARGSEKGFEHVSFVAIFAEAKASNTCLRIKGGSR